MTYPGVLSARGKEVKLYIGAEAAWRPERTRGRGYWETGSEPLHTSYRVPKAVLTPAAGYVAEPRHLNIFLKRHATLLGGHIMRRRYTLSVCPFVNSNVKHRTMKRGYPHKE